LKSVVTYLCICSLITDGTICSLSYLEHIALFLQRYKVLKSGKFDSCSLKTGSASIIQNSELKAAPILLPIFHRHADAKERLRGSNYLQAQLPCSSRFCLTLVPFLVKRDLFMGFICLMPKIYVSFKSKLYYVN
jgi:hypothetical protein